jgi:hypothetical protein
MDFHPETFLSGAVERLLMRHSSDDIAESGAPGKAQSDDNIFAERLLKAQSDDNIFVERLLRSTVWMTKHCGALNKAQFWLTKQQQGCLGNPMSVGI